MARIRMPGNLCGSSSSISSALRFPSHPDAAFRQLVPNPLLTPNITARQQHPDFETQILFFNQWELAVLFPQVQS